MKVQDSFGKARGDLHLEVRCRGELIDVIDEHNLIVNMARTTMARLIGGDVTDRSITQIGFGANGDPADLEDEVLTGAYFKNVEAVSYPQDAAVAFEFELGTDEANGLEIIEFGLLTTGDALFSRKVRTGPVSKNSDISLSGVWTIYF